MRLITHVGRSLVFHWRSHLAVALGVMTATATLTGALLVGDSMRASLRQAALGRLGRVDHALVARRFVHQQIAAELADSPGPANPIARACPAILLTGGMVQADTGARVDRITVLGVDQHFWEMANPDGGNHPTMPTGRSVVLNRTLAEQLGANPGDDVLVRLGKPSPISTETLLGRRDQTRLTMRLTVHSVVPAEEAGSFSLEPRRALPNNAWVPLATLQRALEQRERVNAILVETNQAAVEQGISVSVGLRQMLQQRLRLEDLGLSLRIDHDRGYVALESDSFLIEPAVEQAALIAAEAANLTAAPLLTYLANTIAVVPSDAADTSPNRPGDNRPPAPTPQAASRIQQSAIPYSTVTALDTTTPAAAGLTLSDGAPAPPLKPGGLLLNRWAADDLGAEPGDRIQLTYYLTGPFGQLVEQPVSFVLRGIVRMDARAADPGFTPTYPGLTDTENLADWDPPFPVDLNRVRDRDEDYWDRWRAAPKAFISLGDGRELWTRDTARFGRSTSIRIVPAGDTDLATAAGAFSGHLLRHLEAARLGLAFEPVRERALAASTGSTDFGMLFVSFSFFLIASAAMLVALLFGLGVERRAQEVGILLATGFSGRTVTRLLLAEGAAVAGLGGVLGLLAAVGYAWLMLTGLRSWWSQAVNAPFLQLHAPAVTLVIGFVASLVIALASIAWSIRRLGRSSTRSLLTGSPDADSHISPPRGNRLAVGTCLAALALAGTLIVLSTLTEAVPATVGFFGSGAVMVVACLAALKTWLTASGRALIRKPGFGALVRLGISSATRHPGRSLLAAGLIASATFVIVAVEAFHLDVDADATGRHSGTGGFALLAESAVPLPFDLNTPEGREALGVPESLTGELDGVAILPFRLRPGAPAGCQGLYRPTRPRIIGATDAMIDRGGFVFASALDLTPDETAGQDSSHGPNPWALLRRTLPDGAVPAIGDESAVKWQLHSGLGRDLLVTDQQGQEVRLRFVALLAGSVLQDELVVAESRFVRLFPSIGGHAFFLLDVPPSGANNLAATLERQLSVYAFDVTPTAQRLAGYLAVQNTYLATFQTLGGLGLVLGTLGLAVVLLRNVWERRGELALMRALGFSRGALGRMVLAENAALVVAGLAAGALPALVAIAPHLASRPGQVPWLSLGLTLGGVAIVGIGAGALALALALRAPLLPALRSE